MGYEILAAFVKSGSFLAFHDMNRSAVAAVDPIDRSLLVVNDEVVYEMPLDV